MRKNLINRNPPLSDWMSDIGDDQSLIQMTILGTHDSTSFDEFLIFGKCQTGSITEHLNRGARYLDMRCYVNIDYFQMHHGFIDEKTNFSQVLVDCINFLLAHPKEAILMRIKQEESHASNAQFMKIFNGKYGIYQKYMYFAKDRTIIRLGDVRGKIVIVSNVDTLPGIQWDDLIKQDKDDIDNDAKKWSLIKNQLDLASTANSRNLPDIFYFNGFNGHGPWDGTEKIESMAKYMRKEFLNYLKHRLTCNFYGILAVDFFDIYTDNDLKNIIYSNNWHKLY